MAGFGRASSCSLWTQSWRGLSLVAQEWFWVNTSVSQQPTQWSRREQNAVGDGVMQVCIRGRTSKWDMVTWVNEECSPPGVGASLALISTWPTSPSMAWCEPAKPWLCASSSVADELSTRPWSRAGPHDGNAAAPSVHYQHHARGRDPKCARFLCAAQGANHGIYRQGVRKYTTSCLMQILTLLVRGI